VSGGLGSACSADWISSRDERSARPDAPSVL
jgi:hypothetical protein